MLGVTLAYAWIAFDQARKGNTSVATVFTGYVIANIGFLWAFK